MECGQPTVFTRMMYFTIVYSIKMTHVNTKYLKKLFKPNKTNNASNLKPNKTNNARKSNIIILYMLS